MKTHRFISRLLAVALIIGLPLGILYNASDAQKNSNRDYELLFPKSTQEQLLWPNQQAWIFSVNSPKDVGKECSVSLIARSVHKELKESESPAIFERIISKQEAETTLSLGMIGIDDWGDHPFLVSVQLLNLKELGVQLQEEDKPLRLLMKLQGKMSRLNLTYPETCIEGDFCSGSGGINGKWENGELHMFNLYVVKGNRLTIYDILLSLNEQP